MAASPALDTATPCIKILGTQPGNWDQTQSTDAAASLFTQFGDKVQGVSAEADNILADVIVAARRDRPQVAGARRA